MVVELDALAAAAAADGPGTPDDWRKTLYAVALEQLMANPRLGARSRQIFTRTALRGEDPQDVADSLLVSRNVVDQTKRRMGGRLREIIEKLKDVDGI